MLYFCTVVVRLLVCLMCARHFKSKSVLIVTVKLARVSTETKSLLVLPAASGINTFLSRLLIKMSDLFYTVVKADCVDCFAVYEIPNV
jgi:hypothetical protein